MIEHSSSPDDGEPLVNVHSAAPSELPPSTVSEVAEPPRDEDTIEALKEDIARDHLPHIGAIG